MNTNPDLSPALSKLLVFKSQKSNAKQISIELNVIYVSHGSLKASLKCIQSILTNMHKRKEEIIFKLISLWTETTGLWQPVKLSICCRFDPRFDLESHFTSAGLSAALCFTPTATETRVCLCVLNRGRET